MKIREALLYYGLRLMKFRDAREPNLAELGTGAIANILVVSCTALGDTLLSTPAISSLRARYPKAKITVLIHRAYLDLFSGHADVSDWIPYDGGYHHFFSLIARLRRAHFDLAVILHGNEPQATPLSYLSGARFIFKLPNISRFRFLLTNREPVRNWGDFPHGIDQRLAVAELAGAPAVTQRMTLPRHEHAEEQLAAWLHQQGVRENECLIALQPGASTTSRRWQAARFREFIARELDANSDVRIVVTGSKAELRLAQRITEGIDSRRILVTSGVIPLLWLPSLLRRCKILITGDTGTMHLAITVGTPVLALFAVSDHRRSGPNYDLDKHKVIQKWRTCDPCLSKKCPFPEPICMENISVDEVLAVAKEMLARQITAVAH